MAKQREHERRRDDIAEWVEKIDKNVYGRPFDRPPSSYFTLVIPEKVKISPIPLEKKHRVLPPIKRDRLRRLK
jgi:hypothetical protein